MMPWDLHFILIELLLYKNSETMKTFVYKKLIVEKVYVLTLGNVRSEVYQIDDCDATVHRYGNWQKINYKQ